MDELKKGRKVERKKGRKKQMIKEHTGRIEGRWAGQEKKKENDQHEYICIHKYIKNDRANCLKKNGK